MAQAPLYVCEVDVTFSSSLDAERVKRVLEVDKEISDRATKRFSLVPGENSTDLVVMRVRFTSAEAKILRVVVSSFYDYLTVALKCLQEFVDIGSQLE